MGQINKLWVVRSMETCDGNLFSATAHWVTGLADDKPGVKGSQNDKLRWEEPTPSPPPTETLSS